MTTIDCADKDAVLALLTEAALAGGEIAMRYFRPGAETAARIDYKHGGSPVTEADLEVDRFLRDRLCAALPEAAWLSEETADDLRRLDFAHVIVVDPIDGTRGYVGGDRRWAVSIALVGEGRPVAGVVHVPAMGQTYAARLGGGARRNGAAIHVTRRGLLPGATLAAPAGFIGPLVRAVPVNLGDKVPSLACRFAAVAAGDIDCAVASPNAHDWDIAAVDLILHEAGGLLSAGDGLPLTYNRRQPRHPTLYAAGLELHPALRAAGRRSLSGGA
ncbi:MAG TPA: 3'(2'),5'-bisphosphate nucleotidase CysQ [Lichenihabitans sp.]|nr:3'(2'),5'-bisphosphate nucleotidase CysQ [Lichenihabitans sp.]